MTISSEKQSRLCMHISQGRQNEKRKRLESWWRELKNGCGNPTNLETASCDVRFKESSVKFPKGDDQNIPLKDIYAT